MEGGPKWRVANATIAADAGEYGRVRTNTQCGDYVLKLEFQTPVDGNSGMFLRSAKSQDPHVTGYELQIYDGHEKFPTGSILNAARTEKKVRIHPEKWQSYEVFHLGKRCLVKLGGKKGLDLTAGKAVNGFIGLKFDPKWPVASRNKKVKPPKPAAKPPDWSVKKGHLRAGQGPRQLERKGPYDDFVPQLEVWANSREPDFHPNSGVFLRGAVGGIGPDTRFRSGTSSRTETGLSRWISGPEGCVFTSRRVA